MKVLKLLAALMAAAMFTGCGFLSETPFGGAFQRMILANMKALGCIANISEDRGKAALVCM